MGNKNSKKREEPLPVAPLLFRKPMYPFYQSVDEGYEYFQQRLKDAKINSKMISDEISIYVQSLWKKTLYDILLKCVEKNDMHTLHSLSHFSDTYRTLVVWDVHYTVDDISALSLRHPFQCISASSSPNLVQWVCNHPWFFQYFPQRMIYQYHLFLRLLETSGKVNMQRELIECLCLPFPIFYKISYLVVLHLNSIGFGKTKRFEKLLLLIENLLLDHVWKWNEVMF